MNEDDENDEFALRDRVVQCLSDHVGDPDTMIKAMLNSIGTQRSQLLRRVNEILLNRGSVILVENMQIFRRRNRAIDRLLRHRGDRPRNMDDELIHERTENIDDDHRHQVFMATCMRFSYEMIPFMRSFTVLGTGRFDFPFPFTQRLFHIKLWLEARIKIASPLSALSANPDFVELHQLSVVFGLSSYDDLTRLNSLQSNAILKILQDKSVYNAVPFQTHMRKCMERGVLPSNFRVDRVYRSVYRNINCHLCALYLDLLDGHIDNAMRRSFVLVAWGVVSR